MEKIINCWRELDPEAEGFIDYKTFWKFIGQIAIVLGIPREHIMDFDTKGKFLEILNIPVYENTKKRIYGYLFHDAVLSILKVSLVINYGISQ